MAVPQRWPAMAGVVRPQRVPITPRWRGPPSPASAAPPYPRGTFGRAPRTQVALSSKGFKPLKPLNRETKKLPSHDFPASPFRRLPVSPSPSCNPVYFAVLKVRRSISSVLLSSKRYFSKNSSVMFTPRPGAVMG
jgi:hypothetical protein